MPRLTSAITSPDANAVTAEPISSIVVGSWVFPTATSTVEPATAAPSSATYGNWCSPTGSASTVTAVNTTAAPEDTPRSSGPAMRFCIASCIKMPARPRAAPHITPSSARGKRESAT